MGEDIREVEEGMRQVEEGTRLVEEGRHLEGTGRVGVGKHLEEGTRVVLSVSWISRIWENQPAPQLHPCCSTGPSCSSRSR